MRYNLRLEKHRWTSEDVFSDIGNIILPKRVFSTKNPPQLQIEEDFLLLDMNCNGIISIG